MRFRVCYRQANGSIHTWARDLSYAMADTLAIILRQWLPGDMQAAWVDPQWDAVAA